MQCCPDYCWVYWLTNSQQPVGTQVISQGMCKTAMETEGKYQGRNE